jgi:hypothetical protein
MFNPKILKKKSSSSEMEDSKPMKAGKKNMNYAIESLAPEKEEEGEEEKSGPKKMSSEANVEIDLVLNSAKKKKSK